MVKQIIKKGFSFLGLKVSIIKKTGIKIPNKDEEKRSYYHNEGLKFRNLKKYNFKTIVDIGANEGQFAGKILSIFPGAHIHCFEPLRDTFEQLKNNFREQQNITFYNFGLGSENATVEILKNEYSPSSSLLEMLDIHKKNFDFAVRVVPEKISVKKLDDVFGKGLEKPFLVKIDVQGYEKFVLDGGKNIISLAEVIIIEISFVPLYAGQPLFDDIYHALKNMGFKYAGNLEQLHSPADYEILQADALFVKETTNV